MSDLISRQAAIEAFKKELTIGESKGNYVTICSAVSYEGAKQILESLSSAQQWIPCSERPPEADGEYLVTVEGYLEGEHVLVLNYGTPLLPMNVGEGRAWYLSDIEGDFYYDGVTAWMPLPEPWRGESNDRT